MKQDVLNWAANRPSAKVISKETLNHLHLIEMVSGLDVYQNTLEAYRRAYEALGIDLVNRVPIDNAPFPTAEGETRIHPKLPYKFSHLGVFDTAMRHIHACRDPDEVWNLDMDAVHYEDLIVPVPHSCKMEDILLRQQTLGSIGQYFPMLYTTLFMWAVEVLGWECFMLAAASEPQRFHKHFLLPCVEKSKAIVCEMAETTDAPFVFLHDDLAGGTGPMFRLSWYDEYIFPHYSEIFAEAKGRGKKVVVVADGNMSPLLTRLAEAGADGLMFENPATPLDAVIEVFGQPGMFFIGGIETARLTIGSPVEVRRMVLDLAKKTDGCHGFAIASCGGLHGNIPLANLEAYFDARAEIGATPKDWRTCCRA